MLRQSPSLRVSTQAAQTQAAWRSYLLPVHLVPAPGKNKQIQCYYDQSGDGVIVIGVNVVILL